VSDGKLFGKFVQLRKEFFQGIRERRRIRQRCIELQHELDEVLYQARFIDAENRDLTFLSQNAQNHCVKADILIRKYSRPVNNEYFHHEPDNIDDDKVNEIKHHLGSAVQSINRHNSLVIWGMRGLIISTVILLITLIVLQLF